MLKLPDNIARLTAGRPYTVNSTGMSGAQVLCFDDMVLKIEPASVTTDSEHAMMSWLQGRLPVPELLACERAGDHNFLLMSRIGGSMLCSDDVLSDGDRLTGLATQACQLL